MNNTKHKFILLIPSIMTFSESEKTENQTFFFPLSFKQKGPPSRNQKNYYESNEYCFSSGL